MTITEAIHKVKLVDSIFTPSEASDLVNALIREKINFHKLHRLSVHEGDCSSDTSYDDGRIAQLLKEKENFAPIFKEAMIAGKEVKISGSLEITIIN
ncbi:hypothetical protein [Aquimarina aquimarini]|uniref:hypothetical protein n=1 Tax=Aquimarina aquimarini TaxID=1191734 RepID=UPI000D55D9A1|nr:hypothetical protein [Aquimarina aquimarini]